MPHTFRLLLLALASLLAQRQRALVEYLVVENAVLAEQNSALRSKLGRKRVSFTQRQRRRLAEAGKRLGRALLREYATLAAPDTILGWYRKLAGERYDSSRSPKRGRPRTPQETVDAVLRTAERCPRFGYTRISQALLQLCGFRVSRSTVKRILDEKGIVPAPERGERTTWKDFLAAHWDGLAAGDFFRVNVLTWRGIVPYSVFFVIDLATRRVEVAGISAEPDGGWLTQLARNLTDAYEGFLLGKTKLILDRDPLYTAAFKGTLEGGGVKVVTLPPRSPNLNAYAERFVRSIKEECLDRLVILGEGHLRHAIREFLAHYHSERPHQGLGGDRIDPKDPPSSSGELAFRSRLRGLLRTPYRRAA